MLGELRQLCLEVEGLWEPIRSGACVQSAGHGSQTVLHSDQAFTGKLVQHDVRSLLAQLPAREEMFSEKLTIVSEKKGAVNFSVFRQKADHDIAQSGVN